MMSRARISLLLLFLGLIASASEASARVLLVDEQPTSEKVSPDPATSSTAAGNKEGSPKEVQKPGDDSPKPRTDDDPAKQDGDVAAKKKDDKKEVKDPQDVKKEDGEPKVDDSTAKMEGDVAAKNDDKKEAKDPLDVNKEDGDHKGNDAVQGKENKDQPKTEAEHSKTNDDPKKENTDVPKGEDKNEKNGKPDAENSPPIGPEPAKKEDGQKEGNTPVKKPDSGKMDDAKPETKAPSGGESHVDKSQPLEKKCESSLQRCQKQDLVACLRNSEIGSKGLVLIVLNAGDNVLNVNITSPSSAKIDTKTLKMPGHSAKEVNILAADTNFLSVILNAGEEDCSLQIGMGPSVSDWMQQFPAYAKQLTPMHGAYVLLCTLVIAGGIWACCKFRNRGRRTDNGVQYQQLEMGAQRQSGEIVEASTVDGWEQEWDDDWDNEEATVRPTTTSHNGNVSSNGLSSRSPSKKNDWDIDWDD